MSSNDVVISVTGLGKCYQIYKKPHDRLKQFFFPKLKRIAGGQTTNYYDEFWALKDISFQVKKGETLGIIGRNGSGKSTLLQVLCGTLTPTLGEVNINGRIAALLELGAGFNPEFSGIENVYMQGTLLGLTKSEIDERLESIAAFAEIGQFIEQPVKTYSSGMYVRLAFAVAAHVDADILVIDEALAVGDALFTQKCMRFLRRFKENGTLLFVSHDSGAVTGLCDNALWLDRGVPRAYGPSKEVSEAYLASLYDNSTEGSPKSEKKITEMVPARASKEKTARKADFRLEEILASNLRNDIEVFEFDPNSSSSFGAGAAQIRKVDVIQVGENQQLSYVIGGEDVIVRINVLALADIANPIVGFSVKDRLGQVLFGDNTYISTRTSPIPVAAGKVFNAEFSFQMPILPPGDYTISAAVADGTQEDHVQHHWIHDAVVLRSISSSVSTGLVGIPMENIVVAVEENELPQSVQHG
ncbi:ABC transporter ATP-binding protein [Noviherbaspirillum soli]|uniref:ABC transporter ATP-binding protein n=1 Tax=Noviherbaspirillum soli TaxID=1064518 RepID=UPI00188D1E3E|nr:ABC transporter ATP-binding protein [Noviherbaspirillum soli]